MRDTGLHLRKVEHVLSAPSGEKVWILRLERFLHSEEGALRERLSRPATARS